MCKKKPLKLKKDRLFGAAELFRVLCFFSDVNTHASANTVTLHSCEYGLQELLGGPLVHMQIFDHICMQAYERCLQLLHFCPTDSPCLQALEVPLKLCHI